MISQETQAHDIREDKVIIEDVWVSETQIKHVGVGHELAHSKAKFVKEQSLIGMTCVRASWGIRCLGLERQSKSGELLVWI